MKSETKLKKYMAIESERLKMLKLYRLALDVGSGWEVKQLAFEEVKKLFDKGIRLYGEA